MDKLTEIKVLTSNDVLLMRELLNLFGEVFDEKETYCQNQPTNLYLESKLHKKQFIVIVSLHNNEVVAGLVAYELQKFEQERSEVYIYDLAVKENYRRQKIATKLIQSLKKKATQIGAYVIFVQADYGDDPAIKLYESLGIKENVLHFDINPNDNA